MNTGNYVLTIMFNHYFKEPPKVDISPVKLASTRYQSVYLIEVTKVLNDKFELKMSFWADPIYHFHVNWIAFGY